MTLWYKAGTVGDVSIPMQKCIGRLHQLYHSKEQDLFITSLREGNHMVGSLHSIGHAIDFRYAEDVFEEDIRTACGKDFDVVFEDTHIHTEYDPK